MLGMCHGATDRRWVGQYSMLARHDAACGMGRGAEQGIGGDVQAGGIHVVGYTKEREISAACGSCGGSGKVTCYECNGTGKAIGPDGKEHDCVTEVLCTGCGGSGRKS